MSAKHLLVIIVLLALLAPASPAHAGGVVTVCDEVHLRAALAGGGAVTFACSGTITLSAEIVISADTTIDGTGQAVTISGNDTTRMLSVIEEVALDLNQLTIADGMADYGGGIFNLGVLSVTNSSFTSNHGTNGGGGIGNGLGRVDIDHCMFVGNGAGYGGGAIRTDGDLLTITNSIFDSNDASVGGGIFTDHSRVAIRDTTFSNNSAVGEGGGISGLGRSTDISNTTFLGNSATRGGAIYTVWNGTARVSNSTFVENDASEGGGIYVDGAYIVVSNSTFAGNGASLGGGIYDHYGTSMLQNTVVANSLTGDNCHTEYGYGTIIDGGGNLSYPDATCPGINADPVLGPLQDNGGPTWTMALGGGSAAIDAGDDAICAAPPVNNLDQRGVTRPQGTHCDIGAVEQILDPTAVSLAALSAGSVPNVMPPAIVFGLLLVALMGFGASLRGRQMHWK